MSKILIRRGIEADRLNITPSNGELIYTTDEKLIYMGDGVTVGGNLTTGTPSSILASLLTVDGAGSGLDADLLDGQHRSETATTNTVASRDAASDIHARLFRSEYDTTNPTINYVMTQIDTASNNYVRPSTIAQLRTSLGVENGATGDQSAAEILALLLTVDGSGSLLDADLLDGVNGASYLRSDTVDTFSGTSLNLSNGSAFLTFDNQGAPDGLGIKRITCNDGGGNWNFRGGNYFNSSNVYTVTGDGAVHMGIESDDQNGRWHVSTAPIGTAGNTVTFSSSLTLDNTNLTLGGGTDFITSGLIDGRDVSVDGSKLDTIESNATADQSATEILASIKTVDGAGSGLDADTLDGIDSKQYNRHVVKTLNTTNTDVNRYVKIGTVTISSQFVDYTAMYNCMLYGASLTDLSEVTLSLSVKQQNAFGTNPDIILESNIPNAHDVNFGYVINSNAGPTVVTFYANVTHSYAKMEMYEMMRSESSDMVYLNLSAFENIPAGYVAGTNNIASPVGSGDVVTWCRFNGITNGINDHNNISSITDLGTGKYRLNFTSALASSNYAIGGSAGMGTGNTAARILSPINNALPTTSNVTVYVRTGSGSGAEEELVSVILVL